MQEAERNAGEWIYRGKGGKDCGDEEGQRLKGKQMFAPWLQGDLLFCLVIRARQGESGSGEHQESIILGTPQPAVGVISPAVAG